MKITRLLQCLAAIAVVIILQACGKGYSDGTRVGTVIKLSHKGLALKSWEGELLTGAVTSSTWRTQQGSGSSITNSWKFSVTSDAVAHDIERAMETGKRTRLHYTQWAVKPISIDTEYEIVRVEVLDEN